MFFFIKQPARLGLGGSLQEELHPGDVSPRLSHESHRPGAFSDQESRRLSNPSQQRVLHT